MENILSSIILKKQPFGEGDELITLYTQEQGKVRALAKSSKFSKSKLQYSLQSLFVSKITVTGSGLLKIISAEAQQSFPYLRQSIPAVTICFYMIELVLKATPDQQPNKELFNLCLWFLNFLNTYPNSAALQWAALLKFQMDFLAALGFALTDLPSLPDIAARQPPIGFSNNQGGFTYDDAVDYQPINPDTYTEYETIKQTDIASIQKLPNLQQQIRERLCLLLSGFISYQLERDIKSEGALKESMV